MATQLSVAVRSGKFSLSLTAIETSALAVGLLFNSICLTLSSGTVKTIISEDLSVISAD